MKLLLAALCCLSLAWCPVGENLAPDGPTKAAEPRFVVIGLSVRVTYYGGQSVTGMPTASGEVYSHGPIAALGPALLREAREIAGQQWGMRVRVTDPSSGRSATFRVQDTGLDGLAVDLPDLQWLVFGHAVEDGVFNGRLEVLQ